MSARADFEEGLAARSARDDPEKLPLRYALTFPELLRAIAAVSKYGEEKYEAYNYFKGMPLEDCLDSMLRHLVAWLDGEDLDPESGLSHLAHFAWNVADFVQEYGGGRRDLPRPFRPRQLRDPSDD